MTNTTNELNQLELLVHLYDDAYVLKIVLNKLLQIITEQFIERPLIFDLSHAHLQPTNRI